MNAEYLTLNLSSSDKAELLGEHDRQTLAFDFETQKIKTDYLRKLAEKYDVPVPRRWREDEALCWQKIGDFPWVLTERARADLRAEIWAEQKRRWESWSRWVLLVAGVVGLVGAMMGVVGALSK